MDGKRKGLFIVALFTGTAAGWCRPAPPWGPAHHYNFTLYALDAPLALQAGASKSQLLSAMHGHILAKATLTGLYAR